MNVRVDLSLKTCSSTQGYITFYHTCERYICDSSLKSLVVILFYRSETAATELRVLNSMGIIRCQGVKWQHLIAKDKVDMVTVINSRVEQEIEKSDL